MAWHLSGEAGGGKGRCVGSLWVTLGYQYWRDSKMNAYFMQNYGGYDYGFLYLCGSLAGYTLPYIYNLGNIIVLHSIMEHNDRREMANN